MKKLFFLLLSTTLLFGACSSDDDNDDDGKKPETNLKLNVTAVDKQKVKISLKDNGVVINWGDGQTETTKDLTKPTEITHTYDKAGDYEMELATENLSYLDFTNTSNDGIIGNITLRYSAKLEELRIAGCKNMVSFSVENAPNLKTLAIALCPKLTSIDLSKNTKLETLSIQNTGITKLDVSQNAKLTAIECLHNSISSLDLTKNVDLVHLNCSNNELVSLDLSKNAKLGSLKCNDTKLEALDLSNSPMVNIVEIMNCNLSAEALNSLFTSLPAREVEGSGIMIAGNPGAKDEACNTKPAQDKKWMVVK